MFMQNMEVWKLHSVTDYLFFIAYVAFFALVVYLAIKKINNGRNDASAIKRVAKRLKALNGVSKVYNDVTLDFGSGSQHYDHLIVDAAGIVAVKSIGRGLKIYGTADDAEWKVTDNKESNMRIPNPIKELEDAAAPLKKYLSKSGMYNVEVTPLAVFADTFDTPQLYLGRDSHCIVYDGLKDWTSNHKMRAKGKTTKMDKDAVTALIDKVVAAQNQ